MELCSHNHDEVAFSERKCPVCQMREELEEKIRELKEEVDNFDSRIEEERAIAESYKAKWIESEAEVTRLCKGQLDGER